MKYLEFYRTELDCNTGEEVFSFLVEQLKPGNTTWSYFVNWQKVFANTGKIEPLLKSLNHLVGKGDFDEEFRLLVRRQPEIAQVIPELLRMIRKSKKHFQILTDYSGGTLVYEDFDFSGQALSEEDVEKCLRFVQETGLKDLLTSQKIKNLVDYMIGLEVGIESHTRKNRGGRIMENIVEIFVKEACLNSDSQYQTQVNAEAIKKEFQYDIPRKKTSQYYDFAIFNGVDLFIIETNFYNDTGSKLKATAGEYQNLFHALEGKCKFLWVTDGPGWRKTVNPLRETFANNDYVFNLAMLERGILEFLLRRT